MTKEQMNALYDALQAEWVKLTGIKKGSKLKIIREAGPYENGWRATWNRVGMSPRIGQTLTVREVNRAGIIMSDGYYYPYFVLEVVKDEPKPKAKPGPKPKTKPVEKPAPKKRGRPVSAKTEAYIAASDMTIKHPRTCITIYEGRGVTIGTNHYTFSEFEKDILRLIKIAEHMTPYTHLYQGGFLWSRVDIRNVYAAYTHHKERFNK